jgi:hypothetical protein
MHAAKFVDDDLEIRELPACYIQEQSFRVQLASKYADKCEEVGERIGAEARVIREKFPGNAGAASSMPPTVHSWEAGSWEAASWGYCL